MPQTYYGNGFGHVVALHYNQHDSHSNMTNATAQVIIVRNINEIKDNLDNTHRVYLLTYAVDIFSHEFALLKDSGNQFAYNFSCNVEFLVDVNFYLKIENTYAEIHIDISTEPTLGVGDLPVCALTSSQPGMRYWYSRGVREVALRAEFMFAKGIAEHKELLARQHHDAYPVATEYVTSVLDYAISLFDVVIYRFSDWNKEKINLLNVHDVIIPPKNRGVASLLESLTMLNDELSILDKYKDKQGFRVLVPYIEDIEQGMHIVEIVRACGFSSVGAMIETTEFLNVVDKISGYYDFFVVGCNDLVRNYRDQLPESQYDQIPHILACAITESGISTLVEKHDVYLTSRVILNYLDQPLKDQLKVIG